MLEDYFQLINDMNKIKDYFLKHTFTLWEKRHDGYYGPAIKGLCIAGVVISAKQLTLIENGKIYNLPIVLSYYFACFKTMIENKINSYKLVKKNILFE